MSPYLPYLEALALAALGLPALACLFHGLASLLWGPLPEHLTTRLTAGSLSASLIATLILTAAMAALKIEQVEIDLGPLFSVGDYSFELDLLVDHLTIPFMALTSALTGLIGAFSASYLHREPGFNRFFFLLLLFASGMLVLTMAGSVDLMFAGWETVGVTSALLIGFFRERAGPIKNALRAFAVYRICDVGFLTAAILIHHAAHTARFSQAFAPCAWPQGSAHLEGSMATAVGLLLVFAALGKSAQVPFTGWLPRAMEGPTPSSAIFYGALSIHAGVYLLLRSAPVLDAAPIAAGALVAIGVLTALHATFVGRAQTDIKSALAYASITQVGLIMAEVGLGFRILPLVHLSGHACLRTLQILRSPSILHERHLLEQRLASDLPETGRFYEQLIPLGLRRWLYSWALERGQHDTLLLRWVVAPILALARLCERLEAFVSGADRPSYSTPPPSGDSPPARDRAPARELSPSGRAAPIPVEARVSAPEATSR